MSYKPLKEEGEDEHNTRQDESDERSDRLPRNESTELPYIDPDPSSISFSDSNGNDSIRRDSGRGREKQSISSSSDAERNPGRYGYQRLSIPRKPVQNNKLGPKTDTKTEELGVISPQTSDSRHAQSRPLQPYAIKNLLGLLAELLICLTPVAFLLLAILARSLDGREVSRFGQNIKEWTLLSPTIFPLVFAAVVGRSLRNVARYRIERGCKLLHVEQFVGSQSVFGAIFTQVQLRLIDATGITLILLWLISPLGGQASLRLVSTQNSTITTSNQIGFANLTNSSSQLFDDLQSRIYETTMNGLYTAAMASPLEIKQGAQDSWGNIKIPVLESLHTQADDAGFKPVPEGNDTDWASLLGLPVTGLKLGARTNSTISTQYYFVNCSKLYGADGTTDWPATVLKNTGTSINNTNIWTMYTGSYDFVSQWLVFFNHDYNTGGWPNSSTVHMTFASWSGRAIGGDAGVFYTANTTIAKCTIEPSFVDLQILCQGFSCRATGARRSTRTRPTNATDFQANLAWWGSLFQQYNEITIRDLNTYWTLANPSPDTGQIAPTLMYIGGSEAFPFVTSAGSLGGEAPVLYDLPLPEFTSRMRRLLNTYWQGSIGPPAYNATIPKGDSPAFLSGKTANDSDLQLAMSLGSADATFSHDVVIYKTDGRWLAITILASGVMLLVGAAGFAARCACVGPDVLGSSLTTALRFNKYTEGVLRGNNSVCDSVEVARANKGLVVALRDTRPEGGVGLVALSAEGDEGGITETWRRRKGRVYM